jgi:hypothetical protein
VDTPDKYHSLKLTIRERFDIIRALKIISWAFSQAEAAAFHARKLVEAITFGYFVAIVNSLKYIHRDEKGQWSAEEILRSLKLKNLTVFPYPCPVRSATKQEQQENNALITVEGIPEKRLSHDNLTSIYRALHAWLHEVNPLLRNDHVDFYAMKVRRFGRI